MINPDEIDENVLIAHALNYTANATETGCGVTSAEERKALKLSFRKITSDHDEKYIARLRGIGEKFSKINARKRLTNPYD